jgi:hypothetical protein
MGNILNIINSDKNFYDFNDAFREQYMKCTVGSFWSREVAKYFRLKLWNIENIVDNKLYVYLIECGTKEAVYSSFLHIPEEIIDLVNKDRCKVLISYEAEGDLDVLSFNRWYTQTLRIHEDTIKFNNFYVLHCEINCEKKNRTPINWVSSTHHFDAISNELVCVKEASNFRKLEGFDYDFRLHNINDINLDNKTKFFSSYLRNCNREHRKALGAYFQYNNLWKDNNLSFLKVSWNNATPKDILPEKYWNSISELDNLPPIEIDTFNQHDKLGFNTTLTSDWKHYQETFLSIISETIFCGDSIFFSEKICKPLFNLHPFILMSTPHCLKKLKEFGFQTFHPFIDENYDHEENPLKRMELIFDQLDRFRNKSFEELKSWWNEILPILEHNQNNFIKMGSGKTKKIRLLESFCG